MNTENRECVSSEGSHTIGRSETKNSVFLGEH